MNLRYLSINQLAEVTGVDRRTIKKRLADIQPHETSGRSIIYDAHVAIDYIKGSGSTENIDRQLQQEQLKYESARAEKIQIEVEQMKGILVPIDEVTQVVEKEYTYVRAQMLSIPAKLARPLAMIDDPAEAKKLLEEVIHETLSELTADNKYQQRSENVELSLETPGDEAQDIDATTDPELGGMGRHISIPESRSELDTGAMEDLES